MKQAPIVFMRLSVMTMGLMALLLIAWVLFGAFIETSGMRHEFSGATRLAYLVLIILSATIAPFFAALHGVWRLLNHIDANEVLTQAMIDAFGAVKRNATILGGLYAPLTLILWATNMFLPMIIGFCIVGAPLMVAAAARIAQGILEDVIVLKANKLSVNQDIV